MTRSAMPCYFLDNNHCPDVENSRPSEVGEVSDRDCGKSSESVQCAMLKACDACADMGQL